jgi:hypothetical protein
MLGIGLIHLHVRVLIAVFSGVDTHVKRLRLFAGKTIGPPREQYARAVSPDKLKVVGRYGRARRLAGLRCFRRLCESNCFEHEIPCREPGALDRAPGARTCFESNHGTVDRVSAGYHAWSYRRSW